MILNTINRIWLDLLKGGEEEEKKKKKEEKKTALRRRRKFVQEWSSTSNSPNSFILS